MALRWKLYRSGLLPEVDISERIRANTISVRTNAEEGSVAISSVVVDDPVGNINIPGLYYGLNGYETEAPAGLQSFYHSIITDRTVSRGDSSKSYRTAAAREWTLQTGDQNTLLSRRVMLGADANRPAETDVQRVLYLMASPEMLAVDATDYINTSGPIAMDACDYRGQFALAVLDDCAQASGKNYWVMLREDIGYAAYGLWYDFPESTAYASAITISNVESDVDGVTCFAAAFETTLTRDPSRVYSGVYMPYDGGSVYVNSASTQSNFQGRDTTAPTVNVKTAAKATARANRYLADIDTEEDRIATSIIVPNAQVNALKEGHRVYARFSHLPDYEAMRPCRVLNRTVSQVSEAFYRIDAELTPAGEPEFMGDAFGTIIQMNDTDIFGYKVKGENPPPGVGIQPLVGPLEYVESVAPFYGLRSTSTLAMRVRASLWASFSTVAGPGHTVTVNILHNGVVIGTKTLVLDVGGGWAPSMEIDVPETLMQPGDVISCSGTHDAWVIGGWSGDASSLRVATGTLDGWDFP